jgi:hypothetical protein
MRGKENKQKIDDFPMKRTLFKLHVIARKVVVQRFKGSIEHVLLIHLSHPMTICSQKSSYDQWRRNPRWSMSMEQP